MVVPLLNFPVKGAVWYQGEANSGTAAEAEECACGLSPYFSILFFISPFL
jgi:hypothetical protein